MKTLLLAVTGMSPQVITETLWAIHHEQGAWPAEIQLITTSEGGKRAIDGLLAQGHLQRLCDEIDRPLPLFDASRIHVVTGAEDLPVDDARSRADHEALADFIMSKVAELANDEKLQIHASLAGGRKTMTYYFGYAMSLFGRDQDCLSHVLISEGYENLQDFYYPSATQPPVTSRDGRTLETSAAEVVLADIPFVRLSDSLSPDMRDLARSISFRQLVILLNMAAHPNQIRVELNVGEQALAVFKQGKTEALAHIKLASKPTFALMWVLIEAHMEGDHSLERRRLDSQGNEVPDRSMALMLLEKLFPLCGQTIPPNCVQLEALLKALSDYAELNDANFMRTLETLSGGVTSNWLTPQISNIRKALRNALPDPLATLLSPTLMTITAEGQLEEASKKDQNPSYRFRLNADQFVIKNT
ncbi:CRISPR-associated ring nuclease Csm6 [Halopseudomonas sp.]|jgi:CRISPR-associated protein (TIGR02584 family)|uniref:CRISPR-associated ring nuclease Csm6 n=1 Tax=Halopseudomonas sp. TaxID=2901191 RepID=UPI0030038662